MRIDKISIDNFRCFDHYEISFADKTTVLIGKNGSGKSNLLDSIVYSLSFPFAKNKVSGEQTISTSAPDLKIAAIDNRTKLDARFDSNSMEYIYPLKLNNSGFFNGERIEWAMVKEKKDGGLLSSLYSAAFEKFHNYYRENKKEKPLPVLAFFADSFPHIESNISAYAKSILSSGNSAPRNFGYYNWDKKNNCIGIWKDRYLSADRYVTSNFDREENELRNKLSTDTPIKGNLSERLAELQIKKSENIQFQFINFVNEKLSQFTKPLRDDLDFINEDFEIKHISVWWGAEEQKIQFLFNDGRRMFFDNLPMGYKRLFSIVFDVANRAFILNQATEPSGIVIIDEVELHLHPTLQLEVLARFRKTFPNIQFIVSTHSNLVISNLKTQDESGTNKVVKLVNDSGSFSNEDVENIYGIDYTTNLTEIMEARYRPSTIDKLINAYLVLSGRQKEKEAGDILERLRQYLGGSIPHLLQQEIDNQKKVYDRP